MTIHKFEEAGLGIAPFRLVGVIERRATGQPDTTGRIVGSPGQPLGSCAFCGTGIADCFVIESSDQKKFEVGCVCVNKTGDRGLVDTVKRKANELKTQRRHEKEAARISAVREQLKRIDVRAIMAAADHPFGFDGLTLLDWAEWMLANAGNSGRMKVVRAVDKIVKGIK